MAGGKMDGRTLVAGPSRAAPLVEGISAARADRWPGLAERPREPLEAALGDMVGIVAVERLDMQRDARVHGEGLEELAHQLGVEAADLVRAGTPCGRRGRAGRTRRARRASASRPSADGRRHSGVMPFLSPSACSQGLAERDADILDRVVVVDVQVALGLDGGVDQRMARDLIEHMVEEADAGRDLGPCRCRRARA
jgi:hypothetical protein